jgi:putative FmdB family regulatory protein
MPIYEYQCNACSHQFEEWQKMADAPVTVCPKCKKKKVERLISQTSFQLKGGGWYSDLYSSKKAGSSGGSSGSGGGGDKSSDKSESKKETVSKDSPAPSKDKKAEKSDKKGGGSKTSASST